MQVVEVVLPIMFLNHTLWRIDIRIYSYLFLHESSYPQLKNIDPACPFEASGGASPPLMTIRPEVQWPKHSMLCLVSIHFILMNVSMVANIM